MDILVLLFAIIIFGNSKIQINDDYLSINQTRMLKGIFSIVVVIHHITSYISSDLLKIFSSVGYIAVGFFFFISAYGSVMQLKKKKEAYLGTYILSKIESVVLPYLEITVIYWIYKVLIDGSNLSLGSSLLNAFGIKFIASNCWYVVVLLYFYLFFFVGSCIAVKLKKINISIIICSLTFVFSYYLFYKKYNAYHPDAILGLHWAYSTMLIVAGTVWGCFEEKLRKYISPVFVFSIFLLLCISYYEKVSNDRWNYVLHNISAFCYVVICIFIVRNIRIENKILDFLGSISFETYMIHGLVMKIAVRYVGTENALVFSIFIIGVSLLAAYLLHKNFVYQRKILSWAKLQCSKFNMVQS